MAAPEKVVEVETVVLKESLPAEKEMDVEQSQLPEGVTLYRDIKTTFISLAEENVAQDDGRSFPKIEAMFQGEVKEDSLLVSPDRKFIQFHGYPCSLVLGGHCLGQAVVYAVDSKTSHQIEVTGDEDNPYNLAEGDNLVSPLYRYGKFTGWSADGKLLFEVTYEGERYQYQSVASNTPWVLVYQGKGS